MDRAYNKTTAQVLQHFGVQEQQGLSSQQVDKLKQQYGANALVEDPPTPIWQLILEQFKDQLVIILLGSAAISFVLALLEESDDWTAFVDPVVVRAAFYICKEIWLLIFFRFLPFLFSTPSWV